MAENEGPSAESTTGPEGAADAPPAASPAAVAPDSQATQAGDDEYVRLQREQLKDYDYDSHSALRYAKIGRQAEQHNLGRALTVAQQYGYSTVDEMLDAITSTGEEPPPATGAETPPGTPECSVLTKDSLMAVLDERDRKRAEQEEQQKLSMSRALAQRAESEFYDKTVGELKLEGVRADVGRALLERRLVETMERRLAQDVRITPAEAHRLAASGEAIATDADFAAAADRLKADLADLGNEFVSAAAEGETPRPAATLGQGPGGPTAPPKTLEEMTVAEQRQALLGDDYDPANEESFDL